MPCHIGDNMVSFAYSDNNTATIIERDNVPISELHELILQYDYAITHTFNALFNIKTHIKIIDILHLQNLYSIKFTEFIECNKHNVIVKQYKHYSAIIEAKINALKVADCEFVNNFEFIPYKFLILQHHMHELLVSYIDYVKFVHSEFILKNDMTYYNNMFVNYPFVYSNIRNATINKEFTNTISNTSSVAKNMLLINGNIMPTPKYDLFSAKTGRPYICKGINYQQLASKYAFVIKSQWNDGKIYEFDYNACEIRTAFFATKHYDKANSKLDIYEHFIDVFSKNNIILDRKTIKLFIISMLFGASIKSLSNSIKISECDIKSILTVINNEFKLSIIANSITNDTKSYKYFHNAFGRPIYSDNDKLTTLVQNYIQSTASDICHAGYASMIDYMKNNNMRSCVLFTKHDAITVDMHPDELIHIDEIMKLLSTPIDNIEFKVNKKEIYNV